MSIDVLTFGCSIGFAFHCIALSHVSPRIPFQPLAILQVGFCALFMAISLPFIERPHVHFTPRLILALVIALVQYGDWLHPLLVLGVFAVVQALEGLVIQPKIMGDRVGLHPLTIIIAVMAGTTLFGGLLGGILAIPLTAALRVLMFRYVWKRPQATSTEV